MMNKKFGTGRIHCGQKYYFIILIGFILLLQIPLFLMAH